MYIRWFVSLEKWSDFPNNMKVLPFVMTVNPSVQYRVVAYCKKYIRKISPCTMVGSKRTSVKVVHG